MSATAVTVQRAIILPAHRGTRRARCRAEPIKFSIALSSKTGAPAFWATSIRSIEIGSPSPLQRCRGAGWSSRFRRARFVSIVCADRARSLRTRRVAIVAAMDSSLWDLIDDVASPVRPAPQHDRARGEHVAHGSGRSRRAGDRSEHRTRNLRSTQIGAQCGDAAAFSVAPSRTPSTCSRVGAMPSRSSSSCSRCNAVDHPHIQVELAESRPSHSRICSLGRGDEPRAHRRCRSCRVPAEERQRYQRHRVAARRDAREHQLHRALNQRSSPTNASASIVRTRGLRPCTGRPPIASSTCAEPDRQERASAGPPSSGWGHGCARPPPPRRGGSRDHDAQIASRDVSLVEL